MKAERSYFEHNTKVKIHWNIVQKTAFRRPLSNIFCEDFIFGWEHFSGEHFVWSSTLFEMRGDVALRWEHFLQHIVKRWMLKLDEPCLYRLSTRSRGFHFCDKILCRWIFTCILASESFRTDVRGRLDFSEICAPPIQENSVWDLKNILSCLQGCN